jgi:hypothetical protein
LYRKVEEELVRVGRELKEEKENGEKETRTRKQMETALKVEQINISLSYFLALYFGRIRMKKNKA